VIHFTNLGDTTKKPSILFINRVYPPSNEATGRLLKLTAVYLQNHGWDVTVIHTNAFQGGSSGNERTDVSEIRITDAGVSKHNLWARFRSYLRLYPCLLLASLNSGTQDVVVSMTDPPMLHLLGLLIAWRKKAKHIYWAQDLFPEIAAATGVFHPSGFIKSLLTGLNRLILPHVDLAIVVGRCMIPKITLQGVTPKRIRLVRNIGMERDIHPIKHDANPMRESLDRCNQFVVCYSGNLGRAHDMDCMLKAAESLQEKGDNGVVFLIVGGGAGIPSLKEAIKERNLRNILLKPGVPLEQLSESLSTADLHLVTMKPEACGLLVPCKFYGILASGRPCAFIGPEDSEVAMHLKEHGGGIVIPNGDPVTLVDFIEKLRDQPDLARELGLKARCSLKSYTDAAEEFYNHLNELTSSKS